MKIVGSDYEGNGRCRFTVWAPQKERMVLHQVHPQQKEVEMNRAEDGYFTLELEDVKPGTRYFLKPNGERGYPDPASHFQPEGVHGPTEVVDHGSYTWRDTDWQNLPLQDMVIYELHVGTFTPEGTFGAIIPRLDDLLETGINAIELMPVGQFPGGRNWGYDGVYPYAVQNNYGGPAGLKKLVDAYHAKGIAVLLDVVYNHLGPEGNYLEKFGPYFTDKYRIPWGKAINFDGPYSDGVREYFTNNPLYWLEHFHLDGLRLDAVQSMFDQSAVSVWELLQQKAGDLSEQLGRPFHLVAESNLNSPRVVRSTDAGGMGFAAQWLDDFHHALYVLLDKEGTKFYEDFGKTEQLAKAFTDGFVHSGEYVKFRKRTFGASSAHVPGNRFIAFAQNHDQIGNRAQGERLAVLVDFERLKLAAAAVLLAPYIPMLFMGEEYGEEAPFLYFVSHSDQELIRNVQQGRKKGFEANKWQGTPPDPQDEETFNRCKLQWKQRKQGKSLKLRKWHQELIRLRRTLPALQNYSKADVRAETLGQQGLVLERSSHNATSRLISLFNFSEDGLSFTMPGVAPSWRKLLCSADTKWKAAPEGEAHTVPPKVQAGKTLTAPPLSVSVYLAET
ncbi:MAG: malto-oligosyltrehalose trehalohydrolase [Hymenobacteraceae bacterium]|nr:malto-oligosyltrehalose trehalohydrolase [Hymenobacteraceae bacterium]